MNEQPRLFPFELAIRADETWIVGDSNRVAVKALENWATWPGGALALCGPEASGKSHMAKLWAARAQADIMSALSGPEAAFEAFKRRSGRIVIDDVDKAHDDESITLVLDLARARGGAVLLVGRSAPGSWPTRTRDLSSRFAGLPVATLEEPDEGVLAAALQRLARARYIELREPVARYLAQHMERSFTSANDIVDALDRLMIKGRQPVSYDLARRALDSATASRAGAAVDTDVR
jgi:chromosomal replication initiation ATPase DnaA